MKILFLGDIVGVSGCDSVKKNLSKIISEKKIDFVVVNGENAHETGVGISENITNELISCGVDVITTGKSSMECLKLIKNAKANLVGFAAIIDRSSKKTLKIKKK